RASFPSISLSLCLQAQAPEAEERRSEGSSLYFQCPYTPQTDYQQKKAWCRVRDDQCEPLVETTNPTPHSYTNKATKGNVTIEDDCLYKTVSITMTNLQAEDSGTYSCAHRSNSNQYIALRTIPLIVSKELHKWESDSVSLQCPYGTLRYNTGIKYWCRREGQNGCKAVVWTNYPSTRSYTQGLAGRTRIQDDTKNRTVTITMYNLQAQDSGVYQCAFYKGSHLTPIMEFKLSVSNSEYLLAANHASWQISASPPCSFSLLSCATALRSPALQCPGISWISLLLKPLILAHSKGNRQAEDIYDKPEDTAQLDRTERTEIPKNDSEDLQYVTLNHKSQLSPEAPLYCNVEPSQAHRKPKDENVEYAAVALKQLSTNEKG
uniref:Ig-like domain-containing protein n=1 Tax=Calidris pygmaea TaxID=425635 RepID=A0A8C3KFA4_9CHAR